MKRILTVLLFISWFQLPGFGQRIKPVRYVGFDANPLVSQVLPFNRVIMSDNTFAIVTRRYWENHGFRTSYGVGLGSSLNVNFFQFMIGYDYRRDIGEKWRFFTGSDFIIRLSSEQNSNGTISAGNAQGLGFGGHWGVEYGFNDVLSFSTEASLRLLVNPDDGDVSFVLVPPINFTAHFNITRK